MRRLVHLSLRYAVLAELMTLKPYAVAIAGTHGKTSTTSMVATILNHAGIDPTTVVGGVVDTFGSNAQLGASDWFVTEADESETGVNDVTVDAVRGEGAAAGWPGARRHGVRRGRGRAPHGSG